MTDLQSSGWRFLPSQRQRAVPWSGAEIVLVVLVVYLFLPAWVDSLLSTSGFYARVYGPDEVKKALEPAGSSQVNPDRLRLQMWAQVLALPLQVSALLLLLYSLSDTQPYQLGLTWHRGWQNVALGIAAALVLTPVVIGIQYLAVWLFQHWTGQAVQEHPLYSLRTVLSGVEWLPLLLQVLVAAPVLEEILFRGLLQPWFCQRSWGGHVAITLSLLLAGASHGESARAPFLFVLALLPVYVVVVRRARTPAGPALFGTALLFGIVHSGVWPTPIPLFVLGLGLGWLAWRTQSLVGPIVLHSLFNAVGSIGFFWH